MPTLRSKYRTVGPLASGLLLAAGLALGCTPEPSTGTGPSHPFAMHPTAAPSPAASATPDGSQQTTSVSFQTQVAPLLKARCSACHGGTSAGGVNLFDQAGNARYANIKSRLSTIISEVSSGQMPQGGPRFTASEVELLQSWNAEGAPNN